jgi:Zn-dependent protease with chaperone function
VKSLLLILLALASLTSEKSFSAEKIFPMTPIYESSGSRSKFIGVQIPSEALTGKDDELLALGQLYSLGLFIYPNMPRVTVNGERIGGGVLGTVIQYGGFIQSVSTCIGLCFEFGGSSKGQLPTLVMGSEVNYGIKMNWSLYSHSDLREKSGLWLEDPITQILREGRFMVDGTSAMDVALKTARYGNYRLKAQNRDANSFDWPRAQFSILSEKPQGPTLSAPRVSVQQAYLSKPLRKEIEASASKEGVASEAVWRDTLKPINDMAPVWQNVDAQTLVQKICDALYLAHNPQANIRPRCGVFASLTPNISAYPGGDIFVSTGLLGILPNVDSLIFFLAHEYSHVIARHTTKKMDRQDYAASFYSTLSLMTNVLTLGKASSVASLAQAMGAQTVTMKAMQISIQASLTDHTRGDEDEADLLGIEMAMNLGANYYAVSEGIKVLETYCDDTFKKNQTSALDKFMTADHRELEDRMVSISSHARQYAAEMRDRSSFARSLDQQFTAVYKTVKPLTNYYRLQLKSQ